MKTFYLFFIFLLLHTFFNEKLQAQEVFSSQRELNTYIYQKSDLRRLTSGYFLNYLPDFTPDSKVELFKAFPQTKEREITIDKLLTFTQIIEETDVSIQFNQDSLMFPVMNEIYANNGWNKTRIPLFLGSIDFSYVDNETFESFLKHTGTDPFPSLTASQFKRDNMTIAGLLVDTLVNNHIAIYWNDQSIVSNTDKQITQIQMIIGRDTVLIPKNTDFSLDEYYSYSKPLTTISFRVTFEDKSSFTVKNSVFFLKNSEKDNVIQVDNFAKAGNNFPWSLIEGGFNETSSITGPVRLDFNVLWGCDPQGKKTLDKPFIMVSGWGPFTDNNNINNAQGWPSSIQDFYWSINQKGYVDSLVGSGFDVIFVKFFPPNASVLQNASQLVNLIKQVNIEKFSQGSYQENIISGYSAGSMAVRLALQSMEKNHLDNTVNPHHHCKLFVSFDGEQGGANVPLGLQHAVSYLKQYHTIPGNPIAAPNFTIYALHYILNAPLSRELLKYFYTKTGTSANPKQGSHADRLLFLQFDSLLNHLKNTYNPGYPAFTRNISISNGTSQRTATSPISTYHPYAPENGKNIFFNEKTTDFIGVLPFLHLKTQVYLLGRPDGMVFKSERKPLFKPWLVRIEAYTNKPLILDNAPGGTTFLADPDKCDDQNIMYQVLRRLEEKTQYIGFGNADLVAYDAMYSFTPTLLTHDIRNFTPTNSAGGGLMYYDMKAQGLMFTSKDKISDVNDASPYYGYPHLAHPNDHYTTYTPFDAVFAWDQENTVHIQSGHPQWNENKDLGCTYGFMDFAGGDTPNHKRWEQKDSDIRAVMRNFILGEADVYNTYIQNRSYGWNANANSVYKADIIAKNELFAGDSVTQRTDFKEVIIESNADVQFIACKAIHIKPGFHAKAGSKFHAKINTETCNYCAYSGLMPSNDRHPYSVEDAEYKSDDASLGYSETLFKLYPNPSSISATIEIIKKEVDYFSYEVFDISGKLIEKGEAEGKIKQLSLPQGMYIVKVKINESWESKKLVMY